MKYDPYFFAAQLALLLQYVHWDCAHVVGFSMVCRAFAGIQTQTSDPSDQGGGIASVFSASLPHLVAGKTVFISSAGLLEVCIPI